jgi:hypothetical protein
VLLVEIQLHPEAGVVKLCIQRLGLAPHLALVLAAPDRDDDRLGGRELRRELESPIVSVHQDEPADDARRETPRSLVGVHPLLVLV